MTTYDRAPTTSRRELLRSIGRAAAAAGLVALAVLLARRAGTATPCAKRGGCAGCPAAGRCPEVETPR